MAYTMDSFFHMDSYWSSLVTLALALVFAILFIPRPKILPKTNGLKSVKINVYTVSAPPPSLIKGGTPF